MSDKNDRPATRLSLARAAKPSTSGPEAERARRYVADLARQWGLTQNYALTVHEADQAMATGSE